MSGSTPHDKEQRPILVDRKGHCSLCGGTHYGTGIYHCPFECDRCKVNTEPCAKEGCPRNARWSEEIKAANRAAPSHVATTGETPRTDAALDGWTDDIIRQSRLIPADAYAKVRDLSRELERDLADANQRINEWRDLCEKKDAAPSATRRIEPVLVNHATEASARVWADGVETAAKVCDALAEKWDTPLGTSTWGSAFAQAAQEIRALNASDGGGA